MKKFLLILTICVAGIFGTVGLLQSESSTIDVGQRIEQDMIQVLYGCPSSKKKKKGFLSLRKS